MGYRAFGELPFSQEKLGSIAFLAIAVVFEYLAVIFTRVIYIRGINYFVKELPDSSLLKEYSGEKIKMELIPGN